LVEALFVCMFDICDDVGNGKVVIKTSSCENTPKPLALLEFSNVHRQTIAVVLGSCESTLERFCISQFGLGVDIWIIASIRTYSS
jgi:hypothetical protein